jgi:hypothetical protein
VARYTYDGQNWIVQFDDPDISTYARTLDKAMHAALTSLAPCGRRNSCPGKFSYVPGMPTDPRNDDIYIDSNGCPTERIRVGGQEIVVHYDDIPESDITTVRGLRCTTPLRTVIDIAPETPTAELERIIRDCLDRGLLTVEEALSRIDRPDMAARVGAHMVRSALGAQAPPETPVRLPKPQRWPRTEPGPEA